MKLFPRARRITQLTPPIITLTTLTLGLTVTLSGAPVIGFLLTAVGGFMGGVLAQQGLDGVMTQ